MKTWLSILVILFELASLYVLVNLQESWGGWLNYLIFHAIATVSFTWVCWTILPTQYKNHRISAVSFIFTMAFCMPLVGMIGLATTFVIALYLPIHHKNTPWQSGEQLILPQTPEELSDFQYGAGALREIISFYPDDEKRLQAVNSIRYLPSKEGIPLLKIALNDLTDDVRLMAYSLLDKMEFQLSESIELLQSEYKINPTAQKNYQIAQNFWELCYLGLADGPLRAHYLSKAKEFLLKANDLNELAKVNLLLGRVLLAQNNYLAALIPLEKSLKGGLLMKQVAPYLAEVAFLMNEFEKVRQYVSYLPKQQGDNLSELREFWLEEKY